MTLFRSLASCRLPTASNPMRLLQCASYARSVCAGRLLRFNSTAASTTGKLPAQIPSSGTVNLSPLRGLLALHGPDAAKFLQGLVTKIFPSETEPTGMFTSFLTPQVNPRWSLISGTSAIRYIRIHYDTLVCGNRVLRQISRLRHRD